MALQISLRQFEGPLDLLLHLVHQAKVDIREIFVSEITEQYLASMEGIAELDMDRASEFLVMAALLLEIKSRALLPKPPPPEEEGALSPEEELIRRLEEYRLFKEGADRMKAFEKAAQAAFNKLPEEFPLPAPQIEWQGLSLEGLVRAVERILARAKDPEETGRVIRAVTRDRYTITECVYHLTMRLRQGAVRFEEMLSEEPTRDEVITYFLALLEMLRTGELRVRQEGTYGEILILPGEGDDGRG